MNAYRIKELAKCVFERKFTNLSWDLMPEIHGLWIARIIALPHNELTMLNKCYEDYQEEPDDINGVFLNELASEINL